MDVAVGDGQSLLDAALAAGIPHAHACGGKAACTTCRVVVVDGLDACSAPGRREALLAARLGFPAEVRLACQVRIRGAVTVRRLAIDPEDVELIDVRHKERGADAAGEERLVALLFADIRHFTALSEDLPAYDVIHLLNRFFRAMRQVVERHDGTIVGYQGDGFLALFRLDAEADVLRAVTAGLDVLAAAAALSPWLEQLHGAPLEVSVGVHHGEAVIGVIDPDRDPPQVSAIGDAVNTAKRIEAANRMTGTSFLVSEETHAAVAGLVDATELPAVELAGKRGRHVLYEVTGLRAAAVT